VDNLRYDAAEKRVYVGYGDEKTSAIGMVDAATNKRIDDEFKLGAHPESFQLAASGPNVYVEFARLEADRRHQSKYALDHAVAADF
jgi:hypothetical protein